MIRRAQQSGAKATKGIQEREGFSYGGNPTAMRPPVSSDRNKARGENFIMCEEEN
jgi:hypothetical protein